eukprot:TRINITY_DN51965_c0_g1_i1.p1 TRINITY_DN51965_c0_g1~~TRINITY_DN51965_c0_g1_i1.p1  ORF type:complete len:566 (+),score=110.55 TRINITY_DN51965_c0_g1_i1:119-1816(+)
MGVCLARLSNHQDSHPRDVSNQNGQHSKRAVSHTVEGLAISLERAKALSSNATCTHARYHSSSSGGRSLEEDYEVQPKRVLGEGCSGLVVMAKGRHDGRTYALKKIQKTKVQPKVLKQLTAEVEIYLMLDHPHIAALRDVYETDTEIALLTECCQGGELYSRLSNSGTYSLADAAEATHQMLLAVGYLHAHHIVHRDLKLENFLYENSKNNSPLKLIDFGFAKVWDSSTLMMASCGSIAYVSPDVLAGTGYTNKCDLWSLGVIVFMLLVGYPPFHGSEKEMRTNILAGHVDWSHKSRWKKVSEDAIDFVKCLLVKDPLQRFDASQALQHRWLATRYTCEASLNKETLRSLQRYADTSRMRRAVLQLLAQELAPDETKELREQFLRMDKTGDGTISLFELKDAIRSNSDDVQGPEMSPKSAGMASPKTPAAKLRRAKSEIILGLFDVLDANGDEQIYYSDFLAATMDARKQLREEAVIAAFHRLDADGSGSISVDDLRRVIGETFEGVDVELLVREADAACRGELGFDDFMNVLEDTDASVSPARRRRDANTAPAFFVPQPNSVIE